MADEDGLQARVAALLLERLHLDVPSVETDLIDTGALDSMLFVELLAQLESEFGVTVGLDDLEVNAFRSIRSIAEFVRGRTGAVESWGHVG